MCTYPNCEKRLVEGFAAHLPEEHRFCSQHLSEFLGVYCAVPECEGLLYSSKFWICKAHYRQRSAGKAYTPVNTRMTVKGQGTALRHGSLAMYTKAKCRCTPCKTVWNNHHSNLRKTRANASELDVGTREHGREATYSYGCRCFSCRDAHAKYVKESREIRKLRESMPPQTICDCCGKESASRLVTDHEHGTTVIRGLLCTSCNTGIGKLGDNLEGVLKAVEYLRKCRS